MASIQKLSASVIDYAERMSRWVLLPASGAAVLALVRSDRFTRQAKGVVDDAKGRASELPDDLMKRVRQLGNGSQQRQTAQRSSTSARRTRSRNGSRRASTTRSSGSRSR